MGSGGSNRDANGEIMVRLGGPPSMPGGEGLRVPKAMRSGGDGKGLKPGAGEKPEKRPLREQLPEVWALLKPRRGLLAAGLGLMVVNRLSGLVLPASTKFLIDGVIGKRQTHLLGPLVGLVLLATLVQGVTSYALTQSLS